MPLKRLNLYKPEKFQIKSNEIGYIEAATDCW